MLIGFNDLQSQYPSIALDLDEEKNGFSAKDITYGNTKKIHWKCHVCECEWITSAVKRTSSNTGCPICAKKRSIEKRKLLQVKKTGGLQKYPKLLEQWDYEKNGDIDPLKVNIQDKRNFYWKCLSGQHSFSEKISYRISNDKCPYCSGKKVLKGFNDLESQCENVMVEWDYDKNKILPSEVIYTKTTSKIHWKCFFCGDDFFTEANKHRERGCKICRLKMRHKRQRLEKVSSGGGIDKQKYYDIYLDWDYEKNKLLDYFWEEMTPQFTKKVYWKCHTCGYEWKNSVNAEQKRKGCRRCNKRIAQENYNISTKYPDIIDDWIAEMNDNKNPNVFLPDTHKKFWWKCNICGKPHLDTPTRWNEKRRCSDCGQELSRKARCKSVAQYTEQGVLIKVYESARAATKETGISYKMISRVCNGIMRKTGGYVWKFVNENNEK